MAKIKDIAGGFFDNDTIYSPNGYTQARKVSNAIVDRNISDMQNEIQQGENIGAEARKDKKEDNKASIAELTGNKKVVEGKGLPKPSNPKTTIKKETLVNPDNVSSGATATPVDNSAPGTKEDPNAKYGRKASDPAPKLVLPEGRAGLAEDLSNAEKTLTNKRKERDDFISTSKKDIKDTKRANRDLSIIDDFDFEDEFDGTNPVIAALFKKGSINKLLKDYIKERHADQIAEINDRIKNDPANKGLSGKEKRKLINEKVKEFIEPLWKEAGGDEKVITYKLSRDIAKKIKNLATGGKVHESTYRLYNDLRNIAKQKQNRSVREQLFLNAFDMAENKQKVLNKTAELKGEVKDARSNLTSLNTEMREHKKDVDRARSSFAKDGDTETKVTHKGGWTFFDRGTAHYAAQVEDRDGKKKYVIYSATEGSPDTTRDPVWEFDYQDYNGTNNTNEMLAKQRIEGDRGQVRGGFENAKAAAKEASDSRTFETLDNQNYFDYSEAHKIVAPKILKLVIDRGGKVDRKTGKIYSVSKDDFPEGADELYLDYGTAYKLAKGDDEEVAKLTGMSLKRVKDLRISGMDRPYSIGDARVTVDSQGRAVYQLPDSNMSAYSGKHGSFYINWNNPENRKVVEKYAKMGMTKQDIPVSELKTVNTSRSSEGNIDWTDTKKTKAAEKAQKAQYTGSYKPSKDILDALIGFGNKNKPLN